MPREKLFQNGLEVWIEIPGDQFNVVTRPATKEEIERFGPLPGTEPDPKPKRKTRAKKPAASKEIKK